MKLNNKDQQKVIKGAISPSRIGGMGTRDRGDLIIVPLRPWQFGDDIFKTELRLEMQVPAELYRDKLDEYWRNLKVGQLISVSTDNVEANHFGGHTAEMFELINTNEVDQNLQDLYEELHRPRSYESPLFGTMQFDRCLRSYEGSFEYNGCLIDVSCDPLGYVEDQIDPVGLAFLEGIAQNIELYDAKARNYVATHLLDTKNSHWLDENEKPMSVEEFESKISLRTITSFRFGNVSFWYDDGQIFLGHDIAVKMDSDNNFSRAEFYG